MRKNSGATAVLLGALALGCGGVSEHDAGPTGDAAMMASDAGVPDAGFDASFDAGFDAGVPDAGFDAGVDAGPPAPDELLGPATYATACDTPLDLSGMGDRAFLETFEDGALDVPGVTASAGMLQAPSGQTDSVDADDGAADGSGTRGRSWFSADGATGIRFTFDPELLGGLPIAAGLVWTDGLGAITFEAFDAAGGSLGTVSGAHADGVFTGGTADDHFYGARHAAGISAIHIANALGGIEVDHLQLRLAGPADADCDADGTPDVCQLAAGDCDHDAIPDACDPCD
jgi:hypothetical protein